MRRRTKHQVRNEEHAEYIAWLHTQPCAACGYVGEEIQAAHVGVGGTGLKHGDDDQAIPLCGPHWERRAAMDMQSPMPFVPGCHFDHDNCHGQFRLMDRPQRRATYRAGQCDDKQPSEAWHVAADAAIAAVAGKEAAA